MACPRAPSRSASAGGRSGRRRWIEFGDQAGVEGHETVVVGVVRVLTQELEHTAVAVGGLAVIAALLLHHAEPVPTVMPRMPPHDVHLRVARQQRAGGSLGFVELVGLYEVDDGIGGVAQIFVVRVWHVGASEPGHHRGLERFGQLGTSNRRPAAWLSRCLWASASAACSTASSFDWQHFLYLLPLPQGQGSSRSARFATSRPGLAISVNTLRVGRTYPLYRDLLADATFHHLLLACDVDLAEAARAGRCLICGGALHSAQYPRKPRGRPKSLGCKLGPGTVSEHNQRFSFCCAVDGCRKRETPPSLRFLGRTVYLAATVVLVAIMRHGATTARVARLTAVIGVNRRTIERWRRWWRDHFTATPFWRIARATFMPPVDHDLLPTTLLERFAVMPGACLQRDGTDRLVALLRFIGPATALAPAVPLGGFGDGRQPPAQDARGDQSGMLITVGAP
jgi:hypothetical protein